MVLTKAYSRLEGEINFCVLELKLVMHLDRFYDDSGLTFICFYKERVNFTVAQQKCHADGGKLAVLDVYPRYSYIRYSRRIRTKV